MILRKFLLIGFILFGFAHSTLNAEEIKTPTLDPQELIKKVLLTYQNMQSFQAEVKQIIYKNDPEGGVIKEEVAHIKLAKPDSYKITATIKEDGKPTKSVVTGKKEGGIYQCEIENNLCFKFLPEWNVFAAYRAASLFFSVSTDQASLQDNLKSNPILEGSESYDGKDCYVISYDKKLLGKLKIWISKENFLVLKIQAGPNKEVWSEESYFKVLFNPMFNKEDFDFAFPPNAKIDDKKYQSPILLKMAKDLEHYAMLLREGEVLNEKEAQEIENTLVSDPYDFDSRLKLISYYHSLRNATATEKKWKNHVFWLIEHQPEIRFGVVVIYGYLCPIEDKENYLEGKKMWLKQMDLHNDNPIILSNAVWYFLWGAEDNNFVKALILKGQKLEPDNPEWDSMLKTLDSRDSQKETENKIDKNDQK